ncbi:MAG TPA: hypothetical protein VGR73_15055 [Bryobacteraceae bacterium]|nr:hypothetical protein [Bryobacteraceae bacterium]
MLPLSAFAQGGRGQAPTTAKSIAPIDLTGYWVSLVTEDWRFRMMTPARGDYPSVPLNVEGRKVADAWDPAKDEAEGNQCKGYGAFNLLRMPGRLHITWQDDNTLKLEMDTGMQMRLLHFGGLPISAEASSLQGNSIATWEFAGGRPARGGQSRGGSLAVVTGHVMPGYIQKNGVPYGANAVITEHFDITHEPDGKTLLIVTEMLEDPQYLARRFQRSTHFRKQDDATGWDPSPCSAK